MEEFEAFREVLRERAASAILVLKRTYTSSWCVAGGQSNRAGLEILHTRPDGLEG